MSGSSGAADQAPPARARLVFWWVLVGACVVGTTAAIVYAHQQLTLSHYDARGHLVVARRVIDSLTPGWRQIGAVWLPLPHVLNMLPVQIDWSYRTGFSAVALSILALAWGLASLAAFLFRRSGSLAAAIAAPAMILLNPNVLYLQSTAMTEPLLLGLSFISLDAIDRFLLTARRDDRQRAAWALAALVLTRYEGWCIAGALVGFAALARWRADLRGVIKLAAYPAGAILGFLLLGRAATGSWFTASGFFVPENPAFHDPLLALDQVITGTRDLAGLPLVIGGAVGIGACAWARGSGLAIAGPIRAALPLALLAAGALPWLAFVQGHPMRIRYMVPLVAANGVLAAVAIGVAPGRLRAIAAALLVAITVSVMPPLDATAKMVVEAQWETPYRRGRETVTRYLAAHHDGTPILASMGSLAHYMQETSSIALDLRQFVHEGNGDLWAATVLSPRRHVRWVLIEERAEGGDALALRARDDAAFLDGFRRVSEGGGLALYARE